MISSPHSTPNNPSAPTPTSVCHRAGRQIHHSSPTPEIPATVPARDPQLDAPSHSPRLQPGMTHSSETAPHQRPICRSAKNLSSVLHPRSRRCIAPPPLVTGSWTRSAGLGPLFQCLRCTGWTPGWHVQASTCLFGRRVGRRGRGLVSRLATTTHQRQSHHCKHQKQDSFHETQINNIRPDAKHEMERPANPKIPHQATLRESFDTDNR